MTYLTIGEFAQRTRLSPKALRLYGELGLVVPARVDPDSGYRFYREEQVEQARLVGLLRRLDMPLAKIAEVLALDGPEAAQAVADWWAEVEAVRGERRGLVGYVQARLGGEDQTMYEIEQRRIPERMLLSINRHVHAADTDAFFDEAFARLRAGGKGIEGIAGSPFLVFYGEVSEDSDGPIELCRPIEADAAPAAEASGDIQCRREPSTSRPRLWTRTPVASATLSCLGRRFPEVIDLRPTVVLIRRRDGPELDRLVSFVAM